MRNDCPKVRPVRRLVEFSEIQCRVVAGAAGAGITNSSNEWTWRNRRPSLPLHSAFPTPQGNHDTRCWFFDALQGTNILKKRNEQLASEIVAHRLTAFHTIQGPRGRKIIQAAALSFPSTTGSVPVLVAPVEGSFQKRFNQCKRGASIPVDDE